MRTAEEYREIYENSENKMAAIGKIGSMFLRETALEAEKIPGYPNVQQPEKIRMVLVRQNEKWQKFAELIVNVVRPDGYEILLQMKASDLFSLLKDGVCR